MHATGSSSCLQRHDRGCIAGLDEHERAAKVLLG